MIINCVSFACISVVFFCMATVTGRERASEELTVFAERTAAEISASPLNMPQFKSAKVDTIVSLGKANGTDRYLCWLKADPNRVGYIAVGGDGKSFHVLAFSATVLPHRYLGDARSSQVSAFSPAVSSPRYFIEHLETAQQSRKSLDFSRMDRLSFVENVPLVTAARTFWGTQPLEISETAASLSSVFNYVQDERKILFFGHRDAESNPEYRQRILKDSAVSRSRKDPNSRSLEDECREAIGRENMPRGQTPEQAVTYRVRMRDVIKPIIRRRLLDPIDADERLRALQAEQTAVGGVTPSEVSEGMRDAVFLQVDYLEDGPASIKQNLDFFLKTRGRVASINIRPFATMPHDSMPSVLIGPDNIAAVVLGNVAIDGEQFSLVFLPRTGKPNAVSLADKIRSRGAADRLADPNRARNAEEREGLARVRKMEEATLVVEDPKSKLLDSLGVGIHVCRTSSLVQWRTVDIGKIELADNWGMSEQ
jgi:hypothetical protein